MIRQQGDRGGVVGLFVVRAMMMASGAAALIALSGCAVGPNYVEPQINSPHAWTIGKPGEVGDIRRWWKRMGDPQLDSLVDLAIEGNLDLREAQARVKEARALRGVSASGLLPTLDTSGSYRRQEDSENTGSPAVNFPRSGSDYNSYNAGFDATWELDFFGRVGRGVEAADADIAAAEYARGDVMVTLTSEVVRNYADLRTYQMRLKITRKNAESQADTVKLAQSKADAGLTSDLDVVRAQSNLQTTLSQIPALEAAASKSMHRLGVLLGRHPGDFVALVAEPKDLPKTPGEIAAGVPSELLRRRPDLRNAERQLAAQTARIGVATADLYPRITLSGHVGWSANKFATLFDASSAGFNIGPSVSWNVFDYGRIRSNIAAVDARAEQALIRYERSVINAFAEVEDALTGYAKEQERGAALKLAVVAGTRAVELASELYSRGLTDFNAVLDAQRQLLLVQDTLAQSEGLTITNAVAVFKSLGGGWGAEEEKQQNSKQQSGK